MFLAHLKDSNVWRSNNGDSGEVHDNFIIHGTATLKTNLSVYKNKI